MAETAPFRIEVELERPEHILERVYPNGQLGGFTLEGTPPGPLGTRVDLLLRVGAPTPKHFSLRTQIGWVRHKGTKSYGLDFLKEDAKGRDKLIAFASGQASGDSLRDAERVDVELPVVITHRGIERKEKLADLSRGGAFVRTAAPLPPGTDVELHLRPPRALTKLHLKARVAWAKRDGEQAGMGLQFEYDDDKQAERLKKLVERLARG